MELAPIKYKKAYEKLIADKIINWMRDNIYKPCFEILDSKTVYNSSDVIISALEQGLIYYQDNGFYSNTGRFRNELALEFEKIGAKYSKYRNAFLIDKTKLPMEILGAVETNKVNTALKAAAVIAFLNAFLNNIDENIKTLEFKTPVEKIMMDLQKRVYKSASDKKISFIKPPLSDFRKNEIAKNYTNNLDFWIKNWTEERIIKMRETVGKMVINGKSQKSIAEYIQKEYGIDARHAKFLARNETGLATTSYLEAKYKEEGITEFKWHTILDGRERPLHHQLNGHIFRFDNPPIIDAKTGQRGLPQQTYNCRCSFSPILTKEFWDNRKKLYKKQNGFLNTLKGFLNR